MMKTIRNRDLLPHNDTRADPDTDTRIETCSGSGTADAVAESVHLFTVQETASALGTSTKTIRRWVDTGKLKCVRTKGGHRRIDLSDKLSKASLDTLKRTCIKSRKHKATLKAAKVTQNRIKEQAKVGQKYVPELIRGKHIIGYCRADDTLGDTYPTLFSGCVDNQIQTILSKYPKAEIVKSYAKDDKQFFDKIMKRIVTKGNIHLVICEPWIIPDLETIQTIVGMCWQSSIEILNPERNTDQAVVERIHTLIQTLRSHDYDGIQPCLDCADDLQNLLNQTLNTNT